MQFVSILFYKSLYLSFVISAIIVFSTDSCSEDFLHHDYDFLLSELIPGDDIESSGSTDNSWHLCYLESSNRVITHNLNYKSDFSNQNIKPIKAHLSLRFHPRI